jgi:hypothetical protein
MPSIKREDIESIADRFGQFFRRRREARVRALRDSAEVLQRHLQTWAENLRGQLEEELQAWDQHGFPPPLFKSPDKPIWRSLLIVFWRGWPIHMRNMDLVKHS